MVNGTAFIQRFPNHSKRFTILPNIHPFTYRRRCQPRKATTSSSKAVRVRCLSQGYLNTRLGGSGDRTSNLLVTSQPTLPPALVQLCLPLSRIDCRLAGNCGSDSRYTRETRYTTTKDVTQRSNIMYYSECHLCFVFDSFLSVVRFAVVG